MKGIISDIIPTEYAGYTHDRPDVKIDAYVSAIGFYKRMCLDFIKAGGCNKIVIEKKHQLKQKYHEAIKAELKKK